MIAIYRQYWVSSASKYLHVSMQWNNNQRKQRLFFWLTSLYVKWSPLLCYLAIDKSEPVLCPLLLVMSHSPILILSVFTILARAPCQAAGRLSGSGLGANCGHHFSLWGMQAQTEKITWLSHWSADSLPVFLLVDNAGSSSTENASLMIFPRYF